MRAPRPPRFSTICLLFAMAILAGMLVRAARDRASHYPPTSPTQHLTSTRRVK